MILLDSVPVEPGTAKSVDFFWSDVVTLDCDLDVGVSDHTPLERALEDILDDSGHLVTVDRIGLSRVTG
ncbi:hypothetical protein ACFQMA_08640 [Halosimplex aquaticum]|uniref:Uncharacterized protein n=1 Tax=Halosimplex aquaticum TaxID=3026162 RepID=A0ABD5XXQ2_9EURY|nr:hypothetical protein [Halosimplex aquaticum]